MSWSIDFSLSLSLSLSLRQSCAKVEQLESAICVFSLSLSSHLPFKQLWLLFPCALSDHQHKLNFYIYCSFFFSPLSLRCVVVSYLKSWCLIPTDIKYLLRLLFSLLSFSFIFFLSFKAFRSHKRQARKSIDSPPILLLVFQKSNRLACYFPV